MKVQSLSQWLLASLLVATILSPSLQTTAITEYNQKVAIRRSHHLSSPHHHGAHSSHHRHQAEEEDTEEEAGAESTESERESGRESAESEGHERRHGHSIEHNKNHPHSHQHAEAESALIADEGTEDGDMSVEKSTLDDLDESQVDSVQDDEIEADSVEENGDDAEVDSADNDDDNNYVDENEGVYRLSADEEPNPKWKFLANPYDYKGKNFEQRKTQFTNKAQIMQDKLKDVQDGDEKKALEEKLRFYKAKHDFWTVEDELERKKRERDQHKQLSNDWYEANHHVNKLRMDANKHFANLRKEDQERILAKRDHMKRNLGRGRYKQFHKDGKTAKEGSVWDKYKDHPNHPDNRNKRQQQQQAAITENQQGESATEKYVHLQHHTNGKDSIPSIQQTKAQQHRPLNLKTSTHQELAKEIQRLERILPNRQTNSNRQLKLKRRIQKLKYQQNLRQRKTPKQPLTQAEQDDILTAAGTMFQHAAQPSSRQTEHKDAQTGIDSKAETASPTDSQACPYIKIPFEVNTPEYDVAMQQIFNKIAKHYYDTVQQKHNLECQLKQMQAQQQATQQHSRNI